MSNLRDRTKQFALRIIRLYSVLPQKMEAQVIGKQLLRSGTSTGAHYREATRARSPAEYISKISGGLQELEEAIYWIELLVDAEIIEKTKVEKLLQEAEELTAILVTCINKAKQQQGR